MNKLITFVIIFLVQVSAAFSQDIFDIWDMDAIRDSTTMDVETLWVADTTVENPLSLELINLSVGEIRYNSFGGRAGTIRIQGFFAYPTGESGLPGFLIGHGFGMEGDLDMAEGFAASLHSFVLSISAPGVAGSEGSRTIEDVVSAYPNPQDCWFYQYAYAVMRGLNYLEMSPQVDNGWLCVLGMSAGGVATSLADGIDDRIRFSVPVVSPADFICSVRDSAWMIHYLEAAGIDTTDSEFVYMQRYLAPIQYAPYFHGFVLSICGAQDEFTPLDCMARVYDCMDSSSNRMEIVPNFDHVTYFAGFSDHCGEYDSFDNTVGAFSRLYGTTASVLLMLREGGRVPPMPTVGAEMTTGGIEFNADVPLYFWATDDVTLWLSLDSAWTFTDYEMNRLGSFPYRYHATVSLDPSYDLSNIIYFVEVMGAPYLWLSSCPYVPDGLHPRVRPIPGEYLLVRYGLGISPSFERVDVYPNPFNSSVRIEASAGANIEIYDINGRLVYEIPV
ncbi:MAG: hypothetical protein B6D65_05720, partial [candidate division Zixibacteria bacterium 4484_93]